MHHDIEEIEYYFEGDTLAMPFTVWDADTDDEERKSLHGAEVRWELRDHQYGDVRIDSDDEGVETEIVDPDQGEVEIKLAPDVTKSMRGRNVQFVIIEDDGGNVSTAVGPIRVHGIGPEE